MKIFLSVLFAIIVVGGAWFIVSNKAKAPTTTSTSSATSTAAGTDYKKASYSIDGKPITLLSEGVTYFGNEATGDLNGDGLPDTAFIFTYTGGGSGTFYYVTVARKTADGYLGTNAVLLGDRIAPQTMQIENGELIVNYADRGATEPMTTKPSIGVSKYLEIKNGQLSEIPTSEYAAGNLLLGTDSNTKLGKYLIGSNAMTLYVYAKDAPSVSNCTGGCADAWPPYIVPNMGVLTNLQAGVSGKVATITRADGTLQVTYNSAPLYFYASDSKSGDTTGQGVGGVWSIVKP